MLLEGIQKCEPVFSITIEPPSESMRRELDAILSVITREDPSIRVSFDRNTNQTILSGMGELHLDIIKDKLRRNYDMNPYYGKLQVLYKEHVVKKIEGKNKFIESIKNNDIVVYIEIEPVDINELKNNNNNIIDINSFKKILSLDLYQTMFEGINNALNTGPVLGYPLTNVKVTINNSKSNIPLDCDSQSLLISTQNAVNETLRNNMKNVRLYEPMMKLNIEISDKYIGEVVSDITSRRRGYVDGVDVIEINPNLPPKSLIKSIVPLSELIGYSEQLRAITEGEGRYEMDYYEYAQLPSDKEKQMINQFI